MSDSADTNILVNLAESLLPVQELITGAAYIIGIGFAIKSLMTFKQHGEAKTQMSSQSSIKEPVLYLLIAGMMIYFPTGFDIIMNTSFGYTNVLSYGESDVVSSAFGDSDVGYALVVIIQTIGLYAFTRGWVLISRSASQGQQPGGAGKGLMHVFGGILAVNIVGTLEMIHNTLFGV
jgi:intracellular multiplication protein IcmC